MNAAQMYNEFEITYEALASGDAPGYRPYEVSILLTEAQGEVLKEIVETGLEGNDVKSLVVGPFLRPDYFQPSTSTNSMYADTLEFERNTSAYWLIVGERLKETSQDASVEVRPVTHEFWNINKANPFKKPSSDSYFWRMLESGTTYTKFIITGPSAISDYYVNYLDKPDPIIVPGVPTNTVIDGTTVSSTIVANGQDCAYSTIIHRDIVKRAATNGAAYNNNPEAFQLLKASYLE